MSMKFQHPSPNTNAEKTVRYFPINPHIYIESLGYSAQGQVFAVNSGTKAAVLLKGRSSTAYSGAKVAVLL